MTTHTTQFQPTQFQPTQIPATEPAGDPTESAHEHRWRLDPARSIAEFRVPTYWGLVTVKGRFEAMAGELDLTPGAVPAIDLRIDAASLDTGNRKRDEHLRSEDFFDVDRHPEVRFTARAARLPDRRTLLHVEGELQAAGGAIQLELDATVNRNGPEIELEATTELDQRELGMTTSPMGMIRPRARLVILAHMVPGAPTRPSGDFGFAAPGGRA